MTFEERCRLSEQCLPDAPYREMLTKLHNEMLKALAQPAQKPVAWGYRDRNGEIMDCITPHEHDRAEGDYRIPLYTTPPAAQRTWVGLDAEDRLCAKYMQDAPDGIEAVIDYIEAKLKELNHG